jgi:hypothetical protein
MLPQKNFLNGKEGQLALKVGTIERSTHRVCAQAALEKKLGRDERERKKKGGESSYLLELLNGTLVDTTALVDQVTSGGGLAGIDVADNDDVDVSLLVLTHFGGVLVVKFGWFVWRFESCADKITRI